MEITGIYSITNRINNKVYIGSSKDIKNRWEKHIRDLNKNDHHNSALQSDWIKYGQDNFKFSVIQQCDEIDLKYIELEEINNTWEELYNTPSIKDELVWIVSDYLKKKNKDFQIDYKSDDCANKKPLNFNIYMKGVDGEKELYVSLRNMDYTKNQQDEEKYLKSSKIKADYISERNGDLIEIEYGG